jgi:HPt (histidine-containing phosphotransfer) domain-containing protein
VGLRVGPGADLPTYALLIDEDDHQAERRSCRYNQGEQVWPTREPGMTQDRTAVAHPDELSGRDIGEADGPAEEDASVDETVIEQLASITDGQGFSVLGELLNAFLTAVPGRLETLDRAATAGDLVAVSDQAHALTGSAASFGARRMADLCRKLRAAAQEGDHAGAERLVIAIHAEFLQVRAWLVTFRDRT